MISTERLIEFADPAGTDDRGTSRPRFDMRSYLREHGFSVSREKPWGSQPGGYVYELSACPFDPNHVGGSAAFTLVAGVPGFRCHHDSCKGRGINEIFAGFGTPGPPVHGPAQQWGVPEELAEELPPVKPFPEDILPESFKGIAKDISHRMQVPLDFPACALILCLAGAVNRRVMIQPKAQDTGWVVVPNLWGGIVAPPGFLKSPVIQVCTRPLNKVQAEWRQEFESAEGNYARAVEEDELRYAAWREKFKRSAKNGEVSPERPAKQAIEPSFRRLIINDSTFEALHETMSENPAGIFLIRDELTGWLSQLDRAGREGERAFCLQAWNGDTGHTIDRIGRGTIHVEACCMSLMGGIQPGRLRSYLSDALRDGPGNDGLIQRFQILVWPDLDPQWTYVDRAPDPCLEARMERTFRTLSTLMSEPPALFRFSREAQDLFVAWLETLEAKIRRSGDIHASLVSHLSKFRSLMPSLALLFELVDLTSSEGFDGSSLANSKNSVSVDHARQAIKWCDYLESHAARVYSCAINPHLRAARELADRIKQKKIRNKISNFDWFTARDVYLKGWTGLDTPEAVKAAAAVLEDSRWLRTVRAEPGGTGGRPSSRYDVNPRIWE